MKTNLIIIIILSALAAAWTIYADTRGPNLPPPETPAAETREASAAQVPDFTFTTPDGTAYTLHSFKGKTVILNFWASWCAPCAAEFPQLLNLATALKNDTVLIAISVDEQEQNFSRFMKRLYSTHKKQMASKNILIARDESGTISRDLFHTLRLPETFIIAPNLTIHRKIAGATVKFDSPNMIESLKELSAANRP